MNPSGQEQTIDVVGMDQVTHELQYFEGTNIQV